MRKWMTYFQQYTQKRSISDFALIKLCVFSFGLFLGTFTGERRTKSVRIVSLLLFLGTYIPLIAGFLFGSPAADNDTE